MDPCNVYQDIMTRDNENEVQRGQVWMLVTRPEIQVEVLRVAENYVSYALRGAQTPTVTVTHERFFDLFLRVSR